jgi:hypothetical protein
MKKKKRKNLMKNLREVVKTTISKGDVAFVKKHKIDKHEDPAGNKDDVFNATNVKKAEFPHQKDDAYESFAFELLTTILEENGVEVTEASKEELRDLLSKHVTNDKTTKMPEGSRDPNLSATFRMAGKWMGKHLGNGATPSEKAYQPTWKKSFSKEEVEQVNELATDDQYEFHHKRCCKALEGIGGHLENHKKWTKGKYGTSSVKDLSRNLEDTEQSFASQTEWLKPMKKLSAVTKGN